MPFYANIRRKEIIFYTFVPCRFPKNSRDCEEDSKEILADQDKTAATFKLEECLSSARNRD